MKNKKAYEMSFSWLFAMIIGAFILFLAIYVAVNIIGFKSFEEESESAKKIGNLLNPIATNLEQSKSAVITVPDDTTIFNGCENPSTSNPFGSQEISYSSKQGDVGAGLDNEEGAVSSFNERYLFSEERVSSNDEIYIFSKPFMLPYKIADIMILWGGNEYCFVGTSVPDKITEDIMDLKLEEKRIIHLDDVDDCPTGPNQINVCFEFEDGLCNVVVRPRDLSVTRGEDTVHYIESTDEENPYPLLYAAIFSPPELYECQFERLMKRAELLTETYIIKAEILGTDPRCNFGSLDLSGLIDLLANADPLVYSSIKDINTHANREIGRINKDFGCKLF